MFHLVAPSPSISQIVTEYQISLLRLLSFSFPNSINRFYAALHFFVSDRRVGRIFYREGPKWIILTMPKYVTYITVFNSLLKHVNFCHRGGPWPDGP